LYLFAAAATTTAATQPPAAADEEEEEARSLRMYTIIIFVEMQRRLTGNAWLL
jgi:hypothetical protein